MLTKTQRVRAAIAACDDCYRAVGGNMRTATERIEELWFEIDDQVDAMERAEAQHDGEAVSKHLSAVVSRLARIREIMPN